MAEIETNEISLPKYEESGDAILQDRIVILGRQAAGKTVYLSLLYNLEGEITKLLIKETANDQKSNLQA